MSKLSKAINASIVKSLKNVPETGIENFKYGDVSVSKIADNENFCSNTYRIAVKFQTELTVLERKYLNTELDREAFEDCKRAIIEDVFGEFRPLIHEMRMAIHESHKVKLYKLLKKIEESMFEL